MNFFFSPKCDWLYPIDFIMPNPNPMAKLAYHVKILRKLRLNVPKRWFLAIFTTRYIYLWLK